MHLPLVEMHAIASPLGVLRHPAGDAAVGRGLGIDPRGNRKGVLDVKFRDVSRLEVDGAVECGGLSQPARAQRNLAAHFLEIP